MGVAIPSANMQSSYPVLKRKSPPANQLMRTVAVYRCARRGLSEKVVGEKSTPSRNRDRFTSLNYGYGCQWIRPNGNCTVRVVGELNGDAKDVSPFPFSTSDPSPEPAVRSQIIIMQ